MKGNKAYKKQNGKSQKETQKKKNQLKDNKNKVQQQMLKKLLDMETLNQAQLNIKDLLTNKLIHKDVPLDQSIFKSQLVIKLKVPKQSYIKRTQRIQLGYILRSYSKIISRGYQAAYEDLYKDMEQRGDDFQKNNNFQGQLLIRNICSFKTLRKSNQSLNINESLQNLKEVPIKRRNIEYSETCQEMSGYLDAFIISYNTLIYSLKQFCGFKVKTFITNNLQKYHKDKRYQKLTKFDDFQQVLIQNTNIDRVIYILLYLPNQDLIKAANKYHIKKQIDYAQVDPFLNDPMDSTQRPIKLLYKNQQTKQKLNDKGQEQKEQMQQKIEQIDLKTIDRKLGFILPTKDKTQIINPVGLSQKQINKYGQFKKELQTELQKLIGQNYKILKPSQYNTKHNDFNYFNYSKNEDSLSPAEKDYLYQVNRGKVNPGVQKRYVQIKKQRKYFKILKDLSKKHGYQVFDQMPTYAQFKLVNKKKKFFSRLDKILLYKQTFISPYGDLALFNTMQSIKLSYLVLKQHIRVQNFHMLNCQLFALSHAYEKYGKLGFKKGQEVQSQFHYYYQQEDKKMIEGIQGGLNGHNLQESWPRFFYWKTNYNNIRNYLGESKTFQIFVKTRMIYLFLLLAPLGIGLQILKVIIIDPGAANTGYYPEMYFYLAYMLVISIVYGVFLEKYRRSELNYMQNFLETTPSAQFINTYKGPYMRDIVNDNPSTYNQKYSPFNDTFKIWLAFFVIFLILGIEIGFYYGIRMLIIEISFRIKDIVIGFESLKLSQLIGYSIYFIVNQFIIQFPLPWLALALTQRQNRSTKQSFINSRMQKLFIFSIGVQMIPPVDLLFIQNASKTSCSTYWCAKQLEAYVYSKYLFIIAYSLISFLFLMIKYLKNKASQPIQNILGKKVKVNFSNRLSMFLSFVEKQAKKQPCADFSLVDQTVALIHFATFITILPLAPTLSLFNMLINYNIERTQLLNHNQRPIPKPQTLSPHRKIFVAIGHWMLFYNLSRMVISLQWVQYLFPNFLLAITSSPSQYTLMTVRYVMVLILMLFYEIIIKITVMIVNNNHSIMDKRRINMQQKHKIRILNSGTVIEIKRPKPLSTISRTFIGIKNKYDQNEEEKFNLDSSSKQMLNSELND